MIEEIVVYCGNGGDYEFERDRFYWRCWLTDHGFNHNVVPHKEGDKAIIQLYNANEHDVLMFNLKAPNKFNDDIPYITRKDIDNDHFN